MRAALAARGYAPRHALQAAAIGRVATALFLRTYERAERVHLAMLARGWDQAMPRLDVLVFRRADALFLAGARPSLHRRRADGGMSCAVHATRPALRVPERRRRARRRRPARHARRARRRARPQRRRQDDADAAPQRAAEAASGELEVAGLDVGRDDVRDLRARVGLVFQDPDDQLFMPTVREDVAFGPLNLGCSRIEAEERIAEALAAVRMSEFADRAPHQLSLGQRRRVAIATVLAMRPSLLVLDEPSANLDPRTRRELIELLDEVERTMLVVTHDLPLAARLCERAVILSGGRIVADGPCREILARHRAARRPRPRTA